ncbi:flagellar motor switch protein FliM [Nocardioides anomalus]|uniref:Flagellar motor switch protein FliM n=2 Tax=Nocardioides anomalus TaxID=2712223 RepID=A0A6G6WKQ5_9ACTN|nr:flagellar motor switch protein FliM [Nocardioides anomalus]
MHPSTGAAARRRAGGIVDRPAASYDFRRPLQLSREHSRVLQGVFDGFARQATTIFTSTLRTVCQVNLESVEQRTYAEYVESLGSMTYLTKFSAEPMPGLGVIELPLPAVMSCVDHMLGGPGATDQPQRVLTDIESVVVRGLVDRLLDGLRYGVSELVAIEPVATGVEYSPQFAQVASGNDVILAVTLTARINEQPHRLTVCLPFNGLLPHLTAAAAPAPVSNRERAERAAAAELLDRRLQDVPVDVAVRFRRTLLTPDAFASLRAGDVLRFGHPASAPLDVVVDEAVFAHATAGSTGATLAARIVSTPQELR